MVYPSKHLKPEMSSQIGYDTDCLFFFVYELTLCKVHRSHSTAAKMEGLTQMVSRNGHE